VVRRTATTSSGIDDGKDSGSTISTVSMKDDEDDDEPDSGDENIDDNEKSGLDEVSSKEVKQDKTPKNSKRKKPTTQSKPSRRNPISGRGRTGIEKPRGISIDPGTKIDVIGGPGWHTLSSIDNMNAQLDGALAGMDGTSYRWYAR
jgi:hypothetical protein